MRGCTGSHSVLRWSLSGIRVSSTGWGDLLALRVLFNGLSMAVWGPMMFSGATRGAIQAFRVLFIGLWVALEGPMVFSKATRGAVQILRVLLNNGLWVVHGGPRVESSTLWWATQALRLLFNGLSFEQYNLHLRQKLHLWQYLGIGVIPKKGLLEHVTFFGDSRNPLQYSGVGHTPQISHMQRSHGETLAYTP